MICGYEIGWIITCELKHIGFGLVCCLPVWLLLLYLTLTTRLRSTWEFLMEDSLCHILIWLGISLLVVGVSFLSHVWADMHGLGF